MTTITDGLVSLLEQAQAEEREARRDWMEARAQRKPRLSYDLRRELDPREQQRQEMEIQQREQDAGRKRLAYYACRDRVDKIRATLRVSEELVASL